MKEIFSNKIGTEIFARYFFGLTESIPNDRVIDEEYRKLSKKSLLKEEVIVDEWDNYSRSITKEKIRAVREMIENRSKYEN